MTTEPPNQALIEKVAEAISLAGNIPFADHELDTQVLILKEAKAAISAMGDASTRKDDGSDITPGSDAYGNYPDLQRREISVVDDAISNALECANLFVLKNCHLPKSVEVIQAINAGRDALRTRKPVSSKMEVLKNVLRFADGRCWPEVQAAIDANKEVIYAD